MQKTEYDEQVKYINN